MRKLLSIGACLFTLLSSSHGHAFVHHGVAGGAPPVAVAPTNLSLPEIVGLDTVGSTLTVRPGTYDGTASTKTYRWHMLNNAGGTLGTGATFGPLTSAMVTACTGSPDTACGRIQVDETATNSAGSVTVLSDFVGPVETALPQRSFMVIGTGLGSATVTIGGVAVTSITSQTATNIQGKIPATAPLPYYASGSGNVAVSAGTITSAGAGALNPTNTLPKYPGNYLQNGHAISCGCDVPTPDPPNLGPTRTWYVDPATGGTVASGATGHAGSPFKSLNFLTGGDKGYQQANIINIGAVGGDLQVFIRGTNFGSGRNGSKIYIAGQELSTYAGAAYGTWSNTSVSFFVGAGGVQTAPTPTAGNMEFALGLMSNIGPDGAATVSSVTGTTTFTITGSGFAPNNLGAGVKIGGFAVTTFSTWTNTTIAGTTPGGAPNPTTGNTVVTLGTSPHVQPGDTIYVKNDAANASIGAVDVTGIWSSATGGAFERPIFTWIVKDPTSTANPVADQLSIVNGSGFIFRDINGEGSAASIGTYADAGAFITGATGTPVAPTHDIIFENVSATSYIGHSNDSWNPTLYPSSGGQSDGTIQTASPYTGPNAAGDPAQMLVTGTLANPTRLFLHQRLPYIGPANTPPVTPTPPDPYAWAAGYYYQQANTAGGTSPRLPPANTGIPNGTIYKDIQGRPDLSAAGLGYVRSGPASLPIPPVLDSAYNNDASLGGPIGLQYHLFWGCVIPTAVYCPAGTIGYAGGNATPTISSGLAWVDATALPGGLPAYTTIGLCDPVADHASGCPSVNYVNPNGGGTNGTPFVGCDPLITNYPPGVGSGGCPAGTAPVWNGITRDMTDEWIIGTPRMIMPPKNWWNGVNWSQTWNAFAFQGAVGPNNLDPPNVNDAQGASCVSVKNSMARFNWNQILTANVSDMMFYGNRLKYRGGDAFKVYSSHRVSIIRNIATDASYLKEHQDYVQFAASGTNQFAVFYGNVVVDNEGASYTDINDQFAGYTQTFLSTDSLVNETVVANNVVLNSDNAVQQAGKYNVVVQNDAFSDTNGAAFGIGIGSTTRKGPPFAPNYSMLSNNLTNSLIHGVSVPGVATVGPGINVDNITGPTMTLTAAVNLAAGQITPWNVTSAAPSWPASVVITGPFGTSASTFSVTSSGNYNSAVTGLTVTSIPATGATTMAFTPSKVIPIGSKITSGAGGWPSSVVTTGACNPCTTVNVTASATFSGSAAATGLGASATATSVGDCTAEAATVQGNVLFPTFDNATLVSGNGSSYHCGSTNVNIQSSYAGSWADVLSWSAQDWRSDVAGVVSPVLNYNQQAPQIQPLPGAGNASPMLCLNNEFKTGDCDNAGVNVMNMRPNPSFVPTSPAVSAGLIANPARQITAVSTFPTSGTNGDVILLIATSTCQGGYPVCGNTGASCTTPGKFVGCTFPPGLYTRLNSNTDMTAYGATAPPAFTYTVTPYKPGIVGMGVDLGAQKPPANHARQPWTSPPNVGAY